jgi:curved DNA-binding protein CbpA
MTDHFAALALPRRPWLEPEDVRESFQRAAAEQHPDAPGGEEARFAALNAAHTILREPATRLRHLLELAAPDRAAGNVPIPSALADLFMDIAGLRQAVQGFRQKLEAAGSPLTRALLAGEQADLRRKLEAALERVTAAHEAALVDLRAIDAVWEAHGDAAWSEIANLQARFAFLGKWMGQLREDLFQLTA